MAQMQTAILWHPAPEDPFEDDIVPRAIGVPPQGYEMMDDPFAIDRYEAEQFLLSLAQFYDTAWPTEAEPLAA